jgi:protocatechuate 3,4-dioxygenase beta subunit
MRHLWRGVTVVLVLCLGVAITLPTVVRAQEGDVALGTISGTVTYAHSGEPARGVVVKDYTYINEDDWTGIETVTDEDGRYTLTGLTPGISHVVCVMTGDTPYRATSSPEIRLREGETRTGVDILLVTGGSISGKVTDKSVSYHPSRLATVTIAAQDNTATWEAVQRALVSTADKPLPGVKVVLAEKRDRLNTLSYGDSSLTQETITDENGRYTFSNLRPGAYVVQAEPPEGAVILRDKQSDTFRSVSIQPNCDKDGVDFSFRFDGFSITGRVIDSAGRPIAGAEIAANPMPWRNLKGGALNVEPDPDAGSARTVSDENGDYRLDHLLPASIYEAFRYLTGGPIRYGSSGLEDRAARTFILRAEAPGYTPTQILVPAIHEDVARVVRSSIDWAIREGLNKGEPFTFPDVPLPTSCGNVITGVHLVLEAETVVMGRLIDSRGNLVPESRIRMVFADPPGQELWPLVIQKDAPDWTETDREGEFSFECVPAGVFLFEVQTKALGNQRARNEPLEVGAGEIITDIEVIVEAAEDRGNIEGHVIAAATGAPVEDFLLRVIKVDTAEEDSPRHGKTAIDRPNGRFHIEGISAGVATLELKAPGYAREIIRTNVSPGQTTPVSVHLAPEGILRGYVKLNGQPSAYGYVTIPNVEHSQYCGTNEEGYYELRELKAGTYLVNFTMWLYEDARGGAQACERLWVEVAPGQETRVDVDYRGRGVIQGTFDGREEDKWTVRVLDSSLPEENQLRASTWEFKENRHYEIVDLPPGTYTVVGICTGEDGAVVEQRQTVSLNAGETAQVNFEFR